MAKLADIERQLDDIIPLVKDHDKILVRGNGVPSLQEMVRNLNVKVDELQISFKTYIDKQEENKKYWTRLIGGLLITQLILGIITGGIFIIRIAPLIEKFENALQTVKAF